MSDVEIIRGYVPGAIGRVAEFHGTYDHRDWNFGLFFEAKVATELAAFLGRYEPRRDGFWVASLAGRIEGAITIDGLHADAEGAARHLYEAVGFKLVEHRQGVQSGTEVEEQRFELRLGDRP